MWISIYYAIFRVAFAGKRKEYLWTALASNYFYALTHIQQASDHLTISALKLPLWSSRRSYRYNYITLLIQNHYIRLKASNKFWDIIERRWEKDKILCFCYHLVPSIATHMPCRWNGEKWSMWVNVNPSLLIKN